jgi:hypothetical protein
LGAWAREWLDGRIVAESTRRNYEGFIRNHLVPRLGHKRLAGLARRRWLGHRSVKATVDIYGHLVPRAWHRCREVLQNAMRPVPLDARAQPEEVASPGSCTQAA